MDVRKDRLRQRTREFAVRIVRLTGALPKAGPTRNLAEQLLRSGTSVGAHYAESCRSKSKADFANKITGAMQELEETIYWIYVIENSGIVKAERLSQLKGEMSELMAIFVTMVKHTRSDSTP
ncbi:MAG TPA: four helix bundle protein [bacterium]|jgi:four helix bundle protein